MWVFLSLKNVSCQLAGKVEDHCNNSTNRIPADVSKYSVRKYAFIPVPDDADRDAAGRADLRELSLVFYKVIGKYF